MANSALLSDTEELVTSRKGTPYLSFSRLSRYLHCPEQYRLYYVEGLRPKVQPATLVFGSAVHQALAAFFLKKADPVSIFQSAWEDLKEIKLDYSQRESWDRLNGCGQGLLEKFQKEEVQRIGAITGVEKPFDLSISGLDLPLIGIMDLTAAVDAKRTVVDFKTSGSSYDKHEVILSDQLTTYQLAEPEAEQSAFCVLVKTKEPKIEWHFAKRTGEQLMEFLGKAGYVAREITAGRFYKRSGLWCAWCDYLPVCVGNKAKAEETLIQIG
ncbi:MAG: PD-(D/E)XK nuclease family protein [Desulfobacteraceae bacterium]|nr:MAG: PD-(D/E)XK nuclease family protein [Desulfobacteraceae bacterium]